MAKTGTQSEERNYSVGGSESSSEYGSSTQSHSEGESTTTTHSEGGSVSNSKTAQKSGSTTESTNQSQGGGSSTASGKSWASGTVDDTTLEKRDEYANYVEDQKVTDTYNRLQETIANRPTAFSTNWDSKLNDIYDQLVNGEKFSYDFNKDALYKMYAQQYQQRGKKAAADTLARANAATGGYTNSYAQSVSQQQYNEYLKQLNDIIPELQQQAYQRYLQERADLQNEFNMATQFRNQEYQQYRDTVSDWQADRSFDQSAYQDMRNYERSAYESDRNYWQQEYWNQRNAEQSNTQEQLSSNWSDSYGLANTESWANSETNANERHWDDSISHTTWSEDSVSNTSGWERSNTSNWAASVANATSMPIIATGGAGGGGSVGRSVGSGGVSSVSAATPENWYSDDRDLIGGGLKYLQTGTTPSGSSSNNSWLSNQMASRLSQMSAPENASAEQKQQANEKQVQQLINWVRQGSLTDKEAVALANQYGVNFNLMRMY